MNGRLQRTTECRITSYVMEASTAVPQLHRQRHRESSQRLVDHPTCFIIWPLGQSYRVLKRLTLLKQWNQSIYWSRSDYYTVNRKEMKTCFNSPALQLILFTATFRRQDMSTPMIVTSAWFIRDKCSRVCTTTTLRCIWHLRSGKSYDSRAPFADSLWIPPHLPRLFWACRITRYSRLVRITLTGNCMQEKHLISQIARLRGTEPLCVVEEIILWWWWDSLEFG